MRHQPPLVGNDTRAVATADRSIRIPSELPPNVELYACTPSFTQLTMPAELTIDHTLPEGIWGVLRVLDGALCYSAASDPPPRIVGAGSTIVIGPQLPHRLLLWGGTCFFIEFHIARDRLGSRAPAGSCGPTAGNNGALFHDELLSQAIGGEPARAYFEVV